MINQNEDAKQIQKLYFTSTTFFTVNRIMSLVALVSISLLI